MLTKTDRMKDRQLQGKVITEYLTKYKDTANLTLAKKIYNENKLLFNNLETVRTTIRYYRGAKGEVRKEKLLDKTHIKPLAFGNKNPFALPNSYAQKRESYTFPLGNNNILVLSDLHVPYHDISAITAALEYGLANKVNTIYLNGDVIDCATISKFEPDPRARSFKEEADSTRALLKVIRDTFPDAKIVWLKGNHDIRYEKYLFRKAPEIFDDSYYRLEERLRLNELGIELLDEQVLVYAGKLIMTHGHLTIRGAFSPVNAARGVFIRAKASVLIGHQHQVSEHTEHNLKGEMISCWSTGCLCTLYQPYDPQNTKHSHGFAHVQVEKNGNYSVTNKRIVDGKIL